MTLHPPRFIRGFDMPPSDEELLRCWDNKLSTHEITQKFTYPECCVDSRLWRLRQARRESEA